MEYYTDPNRFEGTDSRRIQAAVDEAARSGLRKTVVPCRNTRTGTAEWMIDETVLLPSDFTLELRGCTLRLAEGVFCNILKNENGRTPAAASIEGEQYGIRILGRDGATLDGGVHNGLTEKTARKNGLPHIIHNTFIHLHNVRDFEIRGLRFVRPRWWAVTLAFARQGRVRDLDFEAHNEVPNQDGVDLRIGCSDILIENLTGMTGDDTLALTALFDPGNPGEPVSPDVAGKSRDIRNIAIRNILSEVSGGHSLVRFLNHDGCRLYNVTLDTVIDRSTGDMRPKSAVRIGDDRYARHHTARPGDTFNISVRNVFSRARAGVSINGTAEDCTFEQIRMLEPDGQALELCTDKVKNIRLNGAKIV